MKVVFLVLVNLTLLFAQPKLDSLMNALQAKNDTVKIKILSDLCWEYRSIHPRIAIGYGETALQLLKTQPEGPSKSQVLNYLGVIYGNLGQLDSAYSYYRRAIQVAKGINNLNEIAYSYNNLGDYYVKNALYSTALENIIEAYDLFEKIGNKQGMAYALNDIGEIYYIRKDYEKALTYYKRAVEIRKDRKDIRGYAKTLINMANAYEGLQQYEKAFEVFDAALEASSSAGYIKGKSWIYAGIANLYLKQEKFYYALQNCEKALAIDTTIANKYGEIINYNRLGKIYMKLGEKDKAKFFLSKARIESEMTGHIDQLMLAHKYMTDLYIMFNDYQSAYNSLREYASLNESIFSQQNLNKIADLQTAFVTERKERENELLKMDIEHQKNTRNLILLIVALILVGVGLGIAKYRSQQRANLLLQELNASKDKFFSIVSHDLKGPIGAVNNLAEILRQDYDQMDEAERKQLIAAFSDASAEVQKLIINLLTWANTQKGGLGVNKVEIHLQSVLQSIIDKNKLLAKNKGLTIELQADPTTVVAADRFIIETIIGNFLSNAIKFSHKSGSIKISVMKSAQNVAIAVADAGVGIRKDLLPDLLKMETKMSTPGTDNERGTGLGLKICKEFAELHNGSIGLESEHGKGSTFTFTFPA